MRNWLKRAFSIISLIFILASPSFAQPNRDSLSNHISKLFESYKNSNLPYGFSLLVADKERVLFRGSYGFSSYENIAPIDPKSKFRLASVSKQFTSALALILQQQGVVNLSVPIKTYVPEFDGKDIGGITLYQLLTNVTGIPTDAFVWHWAEIPFRNDFTVEKLFDSMQNVNLMRKAGLRFNYSNAGFVLAGSILSRITHLSYEQLLYKYIFQPLEMNESGVDHTDSLVIRKASNYEITLDGMIKPARIRDLCAVAPAAGIYSTLGDLSKWMKAIFIDGRLLSHTSYELMIKPYFDSVTYSIIHSYAMGWNNILIPLDKSDPAHIIFHDGTISGTRTMVGFFPDKQSYFVILSNMGENYRYPFSFDPDQVMLAVGQILYNRPFRLRKNSIALTLYQNALSNPGYQFSSSEITSVAEDSNRYELSENELIGIARGLINKDDQAFAFRFLDLAATLFPQSNMPYYYKGFAYKKAGDKASARQYYEQALKIKEDADIRKELQELSN
jgi:CubicO group peptidase (beta-lactamase class C family)